jgi:uncharacterized protein
VKSVLVDAGFLIAIYDKDERHHSLCVSLYETIENPLVTCEAVLAEAIHILGLPSAADRIIASVDAGILEVPFRLNQSASAVREIMRKYRDIPADFADACLIQMADELDTGDILTLDSDFKHYRWRRNKSFNLLIPLK